MKAELARLIAQMHAVNARIEGMKALNTERAANGYALAYDEGAFFAEADELQDIARQVGLLPSEAA